VVGFIDDLKIFTCAVHANLASAISGSVQYHFECTNLKLSPQASEVAVFHHVTEK